MKENDKFDLTTRPSGDVSVLSLDSRRSMQRYRQNTMDMYVAWILESGVLPDEASKEEKGRLAVSGAILKVEHGLDVVAQEAYFIPIGYGGNKKFTLDVSYKGMVKKKKEYEMMTGDRSIPGRVTYLTPDDIERSGLHICKKCLGKGEFYSKKYKKSYPCDPCGSVGKFKPGDCLVAEIALINKKDALDMKELDMEYHPIVGSALWQPCDNVPANRTPSWVVEKNAYKDALRRAYPITINNPDGFSASTMIEEPVDALTEIIAGLCSNYGVAYDDLHALSDFVRNCVTMGGWGTEESVISDFANLGLSYSSLEEDTAKYKLFGFKAGEYPITDEVLASKEPPSGIMVMNAAADVGGLDAAKEICAKLFDGLEFNHRKITRLQLKQILDSAKEQGATDGKQSST